MKFKKMIITVTVATVAIGMHSYSYADSGAGKVTFEGAIVDAPCSIQPGSFDQTVELGQISRTSLLGGGKSTPRPFYIELENCTFDVAPPEGGESGEGTLKNNKITVTFSGIESSVNDNLLGITGSASGAGVAITDGDGVLVTLGKPTKGQNLQIGSNTLLFSAYLQGGASSEAVITEGTFQAVTNFTLAYN